MICKICEKEFELTKDKHYITRDEETTGIVVIARNDEVALYDSFDCPFCGCQNIVQERKRKYVEPRRTISDFCDDYDSCDEDEYDKIEQKMFDEMMSHDDDYFIEDECEVGFCSEEQVQECFGKYDIMDVECQECKDAKECDFENSSKNRQKKVQAKIDKCKTCESYGLKIGGKCSNCWTDDKLPLYEEKK